MRMKRRRRGGGLGAAKEGCTVQRVSLFWFSLVPAPPHYSRPASLHLPVSLVPFIYLIVSLSFWFHFLFFYPPIYFLFLLTRSFTDFPIADDWLQFILHSVWLTDVLQKNPKKTYRIFNKEVCPVYWNSGGNSVASKSLGYSLYSRGGGV